MDNCAIKSVRYCLALDLKDDPKLIEEYEKYHKDVWPDILNNIKKADVLEMDIYRVSNRLFMIMETGPNFSFEKMKEANDKSETNKKWEDLMWNFQQKLPFAKQGEKWILMDKIFSLNNKDNSISKTKNQSVKKKESKNQYKKQ